MKKHIIARGVVVPPDTANTLRDCVKRALRAFADVNHLRGRKGKSAADTAELLRRETKLDSRLMELLLLAAKIFTEYKKACDEQDVRELAKHRAEQTGEPQVIRRLYEPNETIIANNGNEPF